VTSHNHSVLPPSLKGVSIEASGLAGKLRFELGKPRDHINKENLRRNSQCPFRSAKMPLGSQSHQLSRVLRLTKSGRAHGFTDRAEMKHCTPTGLRQKPMRDPVPKPEEHGFSQVVVARISAQTA
jgi:hypothetical protein